MNPTNEIVPNIEEFEASTCVVKSRARGKGGLSIICSPNGKRLTLNAMILENMNTPESIQIAYSAEFLAISTHLGEANTDYLLKASGNHAVIYNAALINEIAERYELDFSNRTSITFSNIQLEENGNQPIIYIKMKSDEE